MRRELDGLLRDGTAENRRDDVRLGHAEARDLVHRLLRHQLLHVRDELGVLNGKVLRQCRPFGALEFLDRDGFFRPAF